MQRYAIKQELLSQHTQEESHWAFDGTYQSPYHFLLRDQIDQGRRGFRVYSAVSLQPDSPLVIVDRGWVAAGLDGSAPHLGMNPETLRHFEGHRTPHEANRLRHQTTTLPTEWPAVIDNLVIPIVSEWIGEPISPFVLRLSSHSPEAFTIRPLATWLTPEKHLGYAVQWWIFALLSWVLWARVERRRTPECKPS